MTPALSLLGMARRAGKVQIGEDQAAEAAMNHKARLILVAGDAGDSARSRARRLGSDRLPVLTLSEGKAELGGAVGYAEVAVAAVTDLGFAAAIAGKLAETSPEAQNILPLLQTRAEKAQRRKADTAKHGKKSARKKS